MVVKDKGTFIKGAALFFTFLIVLAFMLYANVFEGQNALHAADKLFNSISKGSTHYIPKLEKSAKAFDGNMVECELKMKDQAMTDKAKKILTTSGATVTDKADQLVVKGDLGAILAASLKDSEDMFRDNESGLKAKYGLGGKESLYVWWNVFKEMDKSLKRQKRFKEAKFVEEVVKKGVEVGYNFFGIEPQTASSKAGTLVFSLVFYVIYTLWWGVAILLLFEGVGMQMTKGAKKEV